VPATGKARVAEFGGAPERRLSSLDGRACVQTAACGLFGLAGDLWCVLRSLRLIGFMATNHAAGSSAELTMAHSRTSNSANNSALDAAFGISGRRRRRQEQGYGHDSVFRTDLLFRRQSPSLFEVPRASASFASSVLARALSNVFNTRRAARCPSDATLARENHAATSCERTLERSQERTASASACRLSHRSGQVLHRERFSDHRKTVTPSLATG
jgi:hypothetical protein